MIKFGANLTLRHTWQVCKLLINVLIFFWQIFRIYIALRNFNDPIIINFSPK